MERKEAKINKKKMELIVKSEKEKWNLLKKHQEEKKIKENKAKYDKFLIQEPNKMRILVLGEACSGKTCLIKRFINDEFNSEYTTTLRIEGYKSELLAFEETSYKIELIDTPPLENSFDLIEQIIYFVQGIIIVFDGTNKNAFLRMQEYFKTLIFYEFQKIGIIATKKDLCTENDKYKYYQLERFCQQNNAIPFFLSSKNGKEEISNFINLLCPEIIPSLVNKKEDLKLMYPYTKSKENKIPNKNPIDEALLKKAKEEDSSYESEESKIKERDREAEIREYYLKKKMKQEKKIKQKPNYIYNIGNKNKKYREDDNSFNFEDKKEELNDFNEVIGNINIDLEKLFEKYRPDSGSLINDKKRKNNKNKKNKTIEEDRNWVNVNIDSLIEDFMNTKEKLKKKNKIKRTNSDKESKENKESKKDIENENVKEDNKKGIEKDKKKESFKEDKIEGKKEESIQKEKEDKKESENDKKEESENEEKERKKEKEEESKNDKKEESENKNKEESENDEDKNGEEENEDSNKNKEINEEDYEDMIYNLQQNAYNEALKEQEEE